MEEKEITIKEEENCAILIKTEEIDYNYDADADYEDDYKDYNQDVDTYDNTNAVDNADAYDNNDADADAEYEDANYIDEPMEENPWAVDSLRRFLFYNCPECDFKGQDETAFQNHAIESHYQVQF
jgi:hypothetical protein